MCSRSALLYRCLSSVKNHIRKFPVHWLIHVDWLMIIPLKDNITLYRLYSESSSMKQPFNHVPTFFAGSNLWKMMVRSIKWKMTILPWTSINHPISINDFPLRPRHHLFHVARTHLVALVARDQSRCRCPASDGPSSVSVVVPQRLATWPRKSMADYPLVMSK